MLGIAFERVLEVNIAFKASMPGGVLRTPESTESFECLALYLGDLRRTLRLRHLNIAERSNI